MATMPKPELSERYLTAEELLAIRGTPEYRLEVDRQCKALVAHQRTRGRIEGLEFTNWDVPGWTYDAEL